MLSTKTLLKDGRYSLVEAISTDPSGTLYAATDTVRNASVVIYARPGTTAGIFDLEGDSLARIQHDGLMRIVEDFEEDQIIYSVTEPLSGNNMALPIPLDRNSVDRTFERLGAILLAINSVRSTADSIQHLGIGPQMIVRSADGKLKLLLANGSGSLAAEPSVSSSFAPLELVWERLDHITQKAIYNNWSDDSLSLLETPADARTDIYALGAVFYKLLTGTEPAAALHRSIEMLDSDTDSLKTPHLLNNAINLDQSNFLVRMLAIKRERRFGSIEDAIFSLPSLPAIGTDEVTFVDIDPEPSDLLVPELLIAAIPVREPALAAPVAPVPIAKSFDNHFSSAVTVDRLEPAPEPTILVDAAPVVIPRQVVEVVKDTAVASNDDFIFSAADISETPKTTKLLKPLALAAGLILAVFGGWGIYSLNKSGQPVSKSVPEPPVAAMTVRSDQTNATEPADTSVPPPSETSPESTAQAVQDTKSESQPVVETTSPTGQTQQVAEVKNTKARDPKAAAKTDAKPKKKLTVDDLLN